MVEDVGKLPRWARMRIEKAEANVEFWKRKALEAANVSPGATNVVIVDGTEERGLPLDSVVRFYVPDGDAIEVSHTRGGQRPDGMLEIYVRGSRGSGLAIHPASGNVAYCCPAKR